MHPTPESVRQSIVHVLDEWAKVALDITYLAAQTASARPIGSGRIHMRIANSASAATVATGESFDPSRAGNGHCLGGQRNRSIRGFGVSPRAIL
jgi:hypothetical protein